MTSSVSNTVNQTIMMVISKKDNILIKILHETKGYGTRKPLNSFCRKKRTKCGLDSLITC